MNKLIQKELENDFSTSNEEKKLEDDSTKYFYMNKVIDNIKVKLFKYEINYNN